MCHPGVPVVSLPDMAVQNRWFALQQALMVAGERASMQEPEVMVVAGGCSMKQCLCSPTKHPGSFRCRHHHAKYVWGTGHASSH